MTSCGLPTRFAPRSVRVASNCLARHRRPAALAADAVHHRGVRRIRLVRRGLRRLGDEAVGVDAHRGPRVAHLLGGAAVDLGDRGEALRHAADDRQREREAERAGADRRLRAAADRDPDRERVLHRAGVHGQVVDRRPVAAAPRHALGRADLQQQLELLGEELVVVVEVVAEEREGLDERAAPGHDLRAPVAQQVQGRELLEHADGVVRAQDAHRAGQPDVLRAPGGGAQDDGRSAHGEVRTVVLADGEDVEPEGVGELDLLDEVREALLGA